MAEMTPEGHAALVQALLETLATGAEAPQLLETHISSVILAGDYAYKLKKPLDFGFLDFTTLERRRHFCEEEIRLNGRLAPAIYLDVVPVTGSVEAPVLDGKGAPVEYAVRMCRFAQDSLLDRLAASGELPLALMDAVAVQVADFHRQAARAAAGSEFSTAQAAFFPVEENFEQLRPLISDADAAQRLARVEDWSRARYTHLREHVATRGASGCVRECHGDLHLGNVVLIDGEVAIFDGIEFNERMRWTDVFADVAFLLMDLDHRGLAAHGNRFLNSYLEHSGDYAGVALLTWYAVYRAMVRAKIAALRLTQPLDAEARAQVLEEYRSYTALALRYTGEPRPALCITHGLSGSGKSTVAGLAVDRFGLLRLRSDVERKRLHGLDASARTDSALGGGIYDADATRATYARLAELAGQLLEAGHSVLVDATFLEAAQRQPFAALARRLGVPFAILDIEVSMETLQRWLRERQAQGADASEADLAVVEQQVAGREPLAGDELAARRPVNAAAPDIEAALGSLVTPRLREG